MINLKELTLEQIEELKSLLDEFLETNKSSNSGLFEYKSEFIETKNSCDEMLIDTYSIIRTHSAGVWFGKVLQKEGNEIILGEARRLYYWKTANRGISLSEVAIAGLDSSSKVCAAVEKVWLQPIEIIPCTDVAIENIKSQKSFVVPERSDVNY